MNELANIDDFVPLDVYEQARPGPRVDALATVSAGRKGANNVPQASRDGTIVLHDPEGRAPGLKAALEAAGFKSLTVAFPFNDPNQFIQQRFAEYSASKLLAYGDAQGLTVIGAKGERVFLEAGSSEFREYLRRPGLKVQVSVYFHLAAWEPEPHIYFPDGFGYYRLRFTSRNSLHNLKATLDHLRKFTRGLIAGIPLTLRLVNREVAGPDGSRRNVPVWTFTMQPPTTQTLTSGNLQRLLGAGLEAGRSLVLPPPQAEGYELAALEGPDPDLDDPPDPTEADLRRLETGFNPDEWRGRYFAITQGTPYAERPGRAWLVHRATDGSTDSLKAVLSWASAEACEAVCREAEAAVARWRSLEGEIGELVPKVAEAYGKPAAAVWARLREGGYERGVSYDLADLEAAAANLKGALKEKA